MTAPTGAEIVARSMRLLRPPPLQTVSEWADEHRRLSPESSAEPGRWRTDRAPYQRGVMDALTDPDVHRVVWMKSAQVGATEALNNVLGYLIHRQPSPVLVLQPTVDMGKAWSKDRLDPMIRDTPPLRERVYTRRSKEGGSNVLHKAFPGGHVTITGANSAAGLASRPIRVVLADEVDRYPASAGDEGDPLELAVKRTTTFSNRKILVVSTPTTDGRSAIQREFQASDQRFYEVPCPDCGTFQRLVWANVDFSQDAEGNPTGSVGYVCEACGVVIPERSKREMLASGRWVATAESEGIAGFHISELYSPWTTWADMATAFVRAKRKSKEALKTWINTALGEVWVDHDVRIDPHAIEERAEPYPTREPRRGCIVLTAGVDVQADRLEVQIKGWGHDGEAWAVDWHLLSGDPTRSVVWRQLDDYLIQSFTREDGLQMRISATAIDSGFLTQQVYSFVQSRQARRIFATKGMPGEGRPIVGRPTKAGKKGIPLFPVGVDNAKDLFYARLSTKTPGHNYQHYPQAFDREFFEQLTAEAKETRFAAGRDGSRWVKIRKRNEALDLEVLNLAAFGLLNPNLKAIERRQTGEAEPASPPAKERRKSRRWSVK